MNDKDQIWLLHEKYHGEKSADFYTDCARLAAGEPLGYVIGFVPFLDCQIFLDSHPLIPRPETEYWTEKAIAVIQKTLPRADLGITLGRPSGEVRVLDLCAGSGAIGVAVAKAVPESRVTFAEIDQKHLTIIHKNLTANVKNDNQVFMQNTSINRSIVPETKAVSDNQTVMDNSTTHHIIQSNLFENVVEVFDFILTNPPYIDAKADTVEESVTSHEPHLALFGGVNGMEIIARIIAAARANLAPPSPTNPTGGQLWIEHEPFQAATITTLAATHGFISTTYPDQYGTLRYSVLTQVVTQ